MRHEAKNRDALEVTLDVVIGGAGVGGLTPTATIFNLGNNQMWNNSAGVGPGWAWDDAPFPGPPIDYEFVLTPGPWPGLYTLNLSPAHQQLASGLGVFVAGWRPNAGSRGYLIVIKEPINNIREHIHLTVSNDGLIDANVISWGSGVAVIAAGVNGNPLVDADSIPPIPMVDANVVEWGGAASAVQTTLAGVDAAGASLGTSLPAMGVMGWGDEPTSIIAPAGGAFAFPNINVAAYGAAPAVVTGLSGGDILPSVTISGVLAEDASSSVLGMLDVNVMDWNGASDSDGFGTPRNADITAAAAVGAAGGSGDGYPQITVRNWSSGASDQPAEVSQSGGGSSVLGAILPAISVEGWGGDPAADISASTASHTPKVAVIGWQGDKLHSTNGSVLSSGGEIEATWTEDYDPATGALISMPNVRVKVVADDAINESAIEIASVTYEEISDSAVREIVNGVWGASVISPMDVSSLGDFSGAEFDMSDPGTMGHAMMVDYLSKNMIHIYSDSGALIASPMHRLSSPDPTGAKFYSTELGLSTLSSPDEIKSYIDRSAVLVRGLVHPDGVSAGGGDPMQHQHHLVRISEVGTDGVGQYFGVHLVDEDESLIPGGIQVGDLLFIKAETDATMHEIAHEVWEEAVVDHSTPHTFGMFNRIMAGLTQYNHRITNPMYDQSGRLLSCRLKVFETASDAASDSSAIASIIVTSTYDEKQNMDSFSAVEEELPPEE